MNEAYNVGFKDGASAGYKLAIEDMKLDKKPQIMKKYEGDYATLLARVARLEEALPDPDKLEILARWFDMKYPSDANPEVQTDLREWAKKIRRALEEK